MIIHKSYEVVPAWEKCARCDVRGFLGHLPECEPESCPACGGEGGKWHPDIEYIETPHGAYHALVSTRVGKTSQLEREVERCKKCETWAGEYNMETGEFWTANVCSKCNNKRYIPIGEWSVVEEG